ncbi:MAG TPA: protein kinase, partial [Phormidium sp.]
MLLQNRYKIIKLIGQGGFCKTCLAVDQGQSPLSYCVVKQLCTTNHTPLALEKARLLFEQEALLLKQLGHHPQIPSLLAHFEEDGQLYLVQEFMDGTNLARVVEEEGTFGEAEIWQLLDELLPVIKFIHERKVIHRDIKPENIILRSPLKFLKKEE